MFDNNSRYKDKQQYELKDRKGKLVKVVVVPEPPNKSIRGQHQKRQGQRTDHLAFKYLDNPTGFWEIAEANDSMLPESLSEQSEIDIPNKE